MKVIDPKLDDLRLRNVEARERIAAALEVLASCVIFDRDAGLNNFMIYRFNDNYQAQAEAPKVPTENKPEAALDFESVTRKSIPPFKQRPHGKGPSSYGLSSISDLAKHFKMRPDELKKFMRDNGIEYDTYLKPLDPKCNSNFVKAEGVKKLNTLLAADQS